MSNFESYKIGDVGTVQTGPFGSQLHMSDYVPAGTPIITVEHFGENKIIHSNLPLVSDEDKQRLKKYTLQEGDIVVSRVGSVDRRVYVTRREDGWMFSGRCLRVRCNPEIINGRYLSYYFGLESFKEHIRRVAVGATMPSINTRILSDILISAPPLYEQETIAEILSSLDDKIDLLHRNNKTLEALAETHFRQWFIEDADDKWELTTVESAFETKGGGTPSTTNASFWDGEICWTSPRDLSSSNAVFMTRTQRTITIEGLKKISSGLLPTGTVLLSSRAPIGYLAITEVPVAINQGYIACLANDKYSPWYIHSWLKENMEIIHGVSNGSTFMEISKGTFRKLPFVIPSNERLYAYNEIAESWYKKILLNEKQIDQLQFLRDTLLPKLMSGTVTVNNLEMA